MVLLGLILYFLAGSFAKKKRDAFTEAVRHGPKSIDIIEYRHAPHVLYQEMLEGYLTKQSKKQWAVEEIVADGIKPSLIQRWIRGYVKRSVHFLAYYQAPWEYVEISPLGNMGVELVFRYHPDIKFRLDPDITSDRHFRFVNFEPGFGQLSYQYYMETYKVTCRPGSVFPIRLTVFDVKLSKYFDFSWIPHRSRGRLESLSPRLVKILPATLEDCWQDDSEKLPPVLESTSESLPRVPLSPFLSGQIVRQLASSFKSDGNYVLKGYFQPRQVLNRFVLSSNLEVQVELAVALLLTDTLNDEPYQNYKFKACEGIAAEAVVELDLGMLYRVTIRGTLGKRDITSFMFQVSDPEDEMGPTEVNIWVPHYVREIEAGPSVVFDIDSDEIEEYPLRMSDSEEE